MPASPAVRNIVLDIGWVLVRLNYQPLIELLSEHAVDRARNASLAVINGDDYCD